MRHVACCWVAVPVIAAADLVSAWAPLWPEGRFGLVPAEACGSGGYGCGERLRGEFPCRTYSASSHSCKEMNGFRSFNTTTRSGRCRRQQGSPVERLRRRRAMSITRELVHR